ncbi:hypothetical protein EON62_03700, partial [archaeon]
NVYSSTSASTTLVTVTSDADLFTNSMSIYAATLGALLNSNNPEGLRKLPVNQEVLKRAWENTQHKSREEWIDWMRRFSIELLRESPSAALRSCWTLAQLHLPLASELFNAAFFAVWSELSDENFSSLAQALEAALLSDSIPTVVLQTLLNLVEFMEHDDHSIPISVETLGNVAYRVGAYAKALHYKEIEFHRTGGATIEALISINNHLDQSEAAVGILKYVQQQTHGFGQYGYRSSHMVAGGVFAHAHDGSTVGGFAPMSSDARAGSGSGMLSSGAGLDVQEGWYEKLGRWEDALDTYERKHMENPSNMQYAVGRMRCLEALGEWQQLHVLTQEVWPQLAAHTRERKMVAPIAARASWALGQWDEMANFVEQTNESEVQGSFYRSVLSIHRRAFDDAQTHIDRSRKLVTAKLALIGGEGYGRIFRHMVTMQQLTEMEEILTYLRLLQAGNAAGALSYISHVRHMWEARLRGVGKNVEVWDRLLAVRSLVTVASENMFDWLQFASLCRRSGRLNMSLKVLMGLGMDGAGGLSE